MIELICVRHGRTAWNADLRFQGQSDIPLDDEGRAQARALASFLQNESLAFAVASDLGRAVETAQTILSAHPGVLLRLEPDLREMAFGDWEGLTWAQIVASDPQIAREGHHRPKFYTPPNGESFEALVTRTARALERIRAESADGARVLIVTHAGVLHALLRVVLGEEQGAALEVRFTPAGVTRLALDEGSGNRILALNQAS